MNNHSNSNKNRIVEALMKSSGGKIDEQAAQKALQGDTNDVINSLDDKTRKKLMNVISDKQKMSELLNSESARKLMQTLMHGEEKDG